MAGNNISVTIGSIDRAFFEPLRLFCVAQNFLPDVTDYETATGYHQAKELMRQAKPEKQLIEPFGEASEAAKDTKIVSRIIIKRTGLERGAIGSSGLYQFTEKEDETGFEKTILPNTSYDLEYEIRVITDLTDYEELMTNMVLQAFGGMGSIPTYNLDGTKGNSVSIMYLGGVDLSVGDYIEKAYRIRVEDVFIDTGLQPAAKNVPYLQRVIFELVNVGFPDGKIVLEVATT